MAKKFAACKNAAASANDAAAQIQWEKRLFAQHFVGSLADGGSIQTVELQQIPCRAGAAEHVLHAYAAHRGGQLFAQHGVDALSGQLLRSHAGFVDHQAGGDDGNVAALGDLLALADLEVIVLGIVEHRHSQTAKAQIDGAITVMPGMLRMRAKSSQH